MSKGSRTPPVSRGDEVMLDIVSTAHDGAGVGRLDGYAVFVAGALPGDEVHAVIMETRPGWARGELVEIVRPSAERVDAGCASYGECGGCEFRALAYPAQLREKTQRVRAAMQRLAKLPPEIVADCAPAEVTEGYRNKAQYAVARRPDDGAVAVGFYSRSTHRVCDGDTCGLQDPRANQVARAAARVLAEAKTPVAADGSGGRARGRAGDRAGGPLALHHMIVRVSSCTGEIMVVFVADLPRLPGGRSLAQAMVEEVPGISSVYFAQAPIDAQGAFMGRPMLLAGRPRITDCVGNLKFTLSPESFFQVNPAQTRVLYRKALEGAGLHGSETVLDVYAGVGTISLYAAGSCGQIIGVESVPGAVRDARENASLNGIGNASFECGPAEHVLAKLAAQGVRPDVVFLDPPRAGCERGAIDALVRMAPGRIVYVSCNPETLARDLGLLVEAGWRAEFVKPIDMFPHTSHVETVCSMSRETL